MKTKVCKVISTAFVPRKVRINTQIVGFPLGFFTHSQNFPTAQSVIDLLEYSMVIEGQTDPGCAVDIIIVNNDVGFDEGNNFLEKINGKKINNGLIRVLNRENYGRSFAGYNFAFQVFGGEYEYFIFTEDDVLINGANYAQEGIDRINANPTIGFLAYIGINLEGLDGVASGEMIHAHGGVGMASKTSLNFIHEKYGSLPHVSNDQPQDYRNIVVNGEIAFTNVYARNGFLIADIDRRLKLYDFAYDKMRNLNIPRYVNEAMLRPSFRSA
jgi:hypothetical protein